MGIPYLSTFIYQYLARPTSSGPAVNLRDQSVIIDGNSMMYFIYDKVVKDDQNQPKKDQLAKTQFGYDGYRQVIFDIFSSFTKKYATVTVVFDGVYERHPRRRQDPNRESSIRFNSPNGCGNRLPSLFDNLLKCVLRDLDIELIVARGEADPMIVALAEARNAYVVAGDSDYHLYALKQGYVPLRSMRFEQLKGSLYQMDDVFEGMDARAVALWASLIGYDFVSLEDLQVRLIRLRIPF